MRLFSLINLVGQLALASALCYAPNALCLQAMATPPMRLHSQHRLYVLPSQRQWRYGYQYDTCLANGLCLNSAVFPRLLH